MGASTPVYSVCSKMTTQALSVNPLNFHQLLPSSPFLLGLLVMAMPAFANPLGVSGGSLGAAGAEVATGIWVSFEALKRIARWMRGSGAWTVAMIQKREAPAKPGGHHNTGASLTDALLVVEAIRNPEDNVVMVPHAAPMWYSLLSYFINDIPLLQKYRTQLLAAYPSHKMRSLLWEVPGVPTGALGEGPVAGIGLAAAKEYLRDAGFRDHAGNVWIFVGDGEMGEEVLRGALAYIKRFNLKNVKFIINVNLQSLDPTLWDGMVDSFIGHLKADGLPVTELKYGTAMRKILTQMAGGREVWKLLDLLTETDWQSLFGMKADEMKKALLDALDKTTELTDLEKRAARSCILSLEDDDLYAAITQPGGHDFEMLLPAFMQIRDSGQSEAVILWTRKGHGMPTGVSSLANHSMLAPEDALKQEFGPNPWEKFPAGSEEDRFLRQLAARRSTHATTLAYRKADAITRLWPEAANIPETLNIPDGTTLMAAVRTLTELLKVPVGKRLVFISPDVFKSMGLEAPVRKVGLWRLGPDSKSQPLIPSRLGNEPFTVREGGVGQALAFSNSEATALLLAGAFGKQPELIPVYAVYGPFNTLTFFQHFYNVYWGARGISLSMRPSPYEGSQHLDYSTADALMSLPDGFHDYDLAFSQEIVWVILAQMKMMLQNPDEARWVNLVLSPQHQLPNETMNSRLQALRRFSGKTMEVIHREIRGDVLRGGYVLIEPQRAVSVNTRVIFATGQVLDQAFLACDQMRKAGLDPMLVYVTSAGELLADHDKTAAAKIANKGFGRSSWLETLVPEEYRAATAITVTDGRPRYLSWIGEKLHMRTVALGANQLAPSMSRLDFLEFERISSAWIIKAAMFYSPFWESIIEEIVENYGIVGNATTAFQLAHLQIAYQKSRLLRDAAAEQVVPLLELFATVMGVVVSCLEEVLSQPIPATIKVIDLKRIASETYQKWLEVENSRAPLVAA